MKTVQNDMTTGNPMKIILNFTLPIFVGKCYSAVLQYGRCSDRR